MVEKLKLDAIILTTTFSEDVKGTIKFLKIVCEKCERIKKDFIVKPVLVFEKIEDYKFKKVKEFFTNKLPEFDPILLLNKNGIGFSSSLNYGINHTDSKWILRLDTDDLLKEERISNQLEIMEKENLDISSGFMEDQNGNMLVYPSTRKGLITRIAFGMNPIAHPSVCIKRDSLPTLYDTNLRRCEDFELWINFLLKRDLKWKCIGYPITIYNTERSKVKDKENGLMQIKIRIKYGLKLFFISLILLLGILPNFARILLSNNFLLNIRRKLK